MASFEFNEKSKKWSVRFRTFENYLEINKRLSGFDTKKAARLAYEKYVAEIDSKVFTKHDKDITFDELIVLYLKHLKSRVKSSSYYDANSKIKNHITPFFQGKKVNAISPLDILNWQQTIDHYKYVHKTGLRGHLTAIYRFGAKYYNIINIMPNVDSFRNLEPHEEMQCWSPPEFKKFISVCSDERYKALFWLLYIVGCRKGEAMALTWNDIDTEKRTVSITKSVTRKTEVGAWEVTTPKNASSNRTIEIPLNLCTMLNDYKAWQKQQYKDTTFVFCGERPLPDRTTNRYFDNGIKTSGVKKIRIHDLRHSCASLLISQGVSVVAVGKRLGHKKIEQTLNTYSHLMPSDTTQINGIFDEIMK